MVQTIKKGHARILHNGERHIRLSAKKIAALVYVGIALLAVGVVSAQTINSVEWFSSVGRLDLKVSQPDFHLDNGTLGYPYVVVLASVHNPSSYGELYLSGANFGVFVNSTTEAFYPLVTRSEEVALSYREVQNNVPARSGLNLTFAVPIIISIVSPLHDFLNNHNATSGTLITWTQVTLYFRSTYGPFNVGYCYQQPGNVSTVCPSQVLPPRKRYGG